MVHGAQEGMPKGKLVPLPHEPVYDCPYYDVELDVAQSKAHGIMAIDLASILDVVAKDAGLEFFTDHSIWYLDAETDRQRVTYGDLVVARADTDERRITAEDALFVGEVVSTNDRRKEVKDTRIQLALNEYNKVREFALFFPELDDARSLSFFRMVSGRYEELTLSAGAEVASESVPGLAFRVKPRDEWTRGRKVDVLFRGQLRQALAGERERAEREYERAESARQAAEQEKQRAEQEKQRAEQEKQRAEQEKQRAEQEKQRAEEARQAAEEARLRADEATKLQQATQSLVDRERQRADDAINREQDAKRIAEAQRQQAEKDRIVRDRLADRLREMGIDLDDV